MFRDFWNVKFSIHWIFWTLICEYSTILRSIGKAWRLGIRFKLETSLRQSMIFFYLYSVYFGSTSDDLLHCWIEYFALFSFLDLVVECGFSIWIEILLHSGLKWCTLAESLLEWMKLWLNVFRTNWWACVMISLSHTQRCLAFLVIRTSVNWF